MEVLQKFSFKNPLFPLYSNEQKVNIRFKFLGKILEELQVGIPLWKKLVQRKGKLELQGKNHAQSGQYRKGNDNEQSPLIIHAIRLLLNGSQE
jgi:hypothetical protein